MESFRRPLEGGMIAFRALLLTHPRSVVPARGIGAAVPVQYLPGRSVSSQSFVADFGFHLSAADNIGVRVDVSSGYARRRRQCVVANACGAFGFGYGGRRVQAPPIEILGGRACYTGAICNDRVPFVTD